jgi:hypothetical protein
MEQPIHTYRLTSSEYERLLLERDDLAAEFGPDGFMALLRENEGTRVNDVMHSISVYDAGWYWVHTTEPIDWA